MKNKNENKKKEKNIFQIDKHSTKGCVGRNKRYKNETKNKNENNIKLKFFRYSKGKNIKYFKNLLLIITFFSMTIETIKYNSSYIEFKIKGDSLNKIFFETLGEDQCTKTIFPDEIHINGINQSEIKSEYKFTDPMSRVKLIWIKKINSINCLFYHCSNITEVDLSHFDSSDVTDMRFLFNDCRSLTSIDFTDFDTSKVEYMNSMFHDCISLTSVNISNFITNNVIWIGSMFRNCKSLKSIDLSNFVTNNVGQMDFMFYNCVSLTSVNLQNFDFSSAYWIESMFDGCINLEYINLKKFEKSGLKYDNIFRGIPENIVICLDEAKAPNLANLIKGKTCYSLVCSDDWKAGQKILINDTEKGNYCVCNEENPFLLIEKYLCVNNCDINLILSGLCIFDYYLDISSDEIYIEKELKQKEIKVLDKLLNSIEKSFTSENYDTTNLEKGKEEIIPNNKVTITLTTTDNQKNNNNSNITTIDLGDCEYKLREAYNIPNNSKIFMKKIDVIQEGLKIPKVEYDIYSKLNGKNLTKLNLSVCGNEKIIINIPVVITESLDKVNMSSGYYNDICHKAASDSGTDITLNDRKIEFIEGNKTICQEECQFSEYNYDELKASCSCKITESSSSLADMKINKEKFYEKVDSKSKSSLEITSCNILGSKENIESNTGFYLLLFIIVIFIIIFIIFCTKGYNDFKIKIDDIIFKKFKDENNKKDNKIQKNNNENNKKDNKITKNNKKNKSLKKSKSKSSKNNSKHALNDKNQDKNNKAKNISVLNDKINKKNNNSLKPNTDYELNWISYDDALRYDKRSNCDYYCSLIRTKQLFIFTFFSFNDYNSGIIKKFIFFLSFALHYTVNALFFTDNTFHQIYQDEGKFNFEYQLPKIIYSTLISTFVLRLMLHFLVLTDKDVLQVKLQTTKKMALSLKEQKLKCILIKFTIFFILNFILLVLFWYYLTCFNAIYENTQIYLIENTFISFGFSLFYPFIINIIPTIIRMGSIHSSKKNQNYCYRVSQIVQLI